MSACSIRQGCDFYQSVEGSLGKRVRFASAFPYCKGGRHESCAIHRLMKSGQEVPPGLTPDGSFAVDTVGGTEAGAGHAGQFLVVDDSPVFATLAANTVRQHIPGSDVAVCTSFEEAVYYVSSGALRLVVSGYGLGGGKTVLDLRHLTAAPIVVFTGMPESMRELPSRSLVVAKGAGPRALCGAMDALLSA